MNTGVKTSPIKTVNPFNNQIEKEFDVMSKEEVTNIIGKADKAFQSWKKTSFAERKRLMKKVVDIIRKRKDELAELATIEMGKLLKESKAELDICADIFDYYAENAENLLKDKVLQTPKGKAFISYEPIGVILSVQPWNFPFYQITRSAAPNLMAGNTMVLKHASNVPQCAKVMEEIFLQAGFPEGVYNNLFIPGSQIEAIVSDKRIKGVTLTGSEPAGASIASEAGKYVKKSTLELGGSDPFVVLEDADVDTAVRTAVYGRMWNAGQVCVSPKRIIVPASLYDRFLAKTKEIFKTLKVGNPLKDDTDVAPLSTEKAAQDVVKQIERAVAKGAKLVTGGHRVDRPGAFVEPTILTDIDKNNDAYYEEIFGPVLMLYSYKTIDEAVELANATEFGLGGSVFAKDTEKAVEVARRIDTGMVYINHVTGIAAELPFGGTKNSGYGREQSELGMYEFVNQKLIRLTTPDAAY